MYRILCGLLLFPATTTLNAADTPSPETALRFRPVQEDVEFETPDPQQYSQCKVKVERNASGSGWVVSGPGGQVLRRYVDTNGDNVVDQWRYYNHGLEVYRDIDSDFNKRVDQSRWLNSAGSRWGTDADEDGKIDVWKVLSAEEATRVAIRSLVNGDERTLKTLLIDRQDIESLGIREPYAQKLLDAVSDAGRKLQAARSGTNLISSQTHWIRFDGSMPSAIPPEAGKASGDLRVYENVMAITETSEQPGFVRIGEMVRVGDVWKLTQIPQPLEGNSIEVAEGGTLMQPQFADAGGSGGSGGSQTVSPQAQELLERLRKLDSNSPPPGSSRSDLARYNSQRAELLTELIELASNEQERRQWMQQMVDGLTSTVQSGGYPQGIERLKSLATELRQESPNSPMVPYVEYRISLAQYSLDVQQAEPDEQPKIQERWLQELEGFVEKYPGSDDAPDAMLQLGINREFAADTDAARTWYSRLAEQHGETEAGQRARGALRRLGLRGQKLAFSGPGLDGQTVDVTRYRGQIVLVSFWATWCQPCTQDLPQLRSLYQQYHDRGFQIIGVNVDTHVEPVRPYLQQHRVSWPQIFQPGGLTSEPAQSFGIFSLPTRFLVDQDGTVVTRNASVDDVKSFLAERLK